MFSQLLLCLFLFNTAVDGSEIPKQPPGMFLKPCKQWDFNYQPQLVLVGFFIASNMMNSLHKNHWSFSRSSYFPCSRAETSLKLRQKTMCIYFPLLRTVGHFFLKQLTLWVNKRGIMRKSLGGCVKSHFVSLESFAVDVFFLIVVVVLVLVLVLVVVVVVVVVEICHFEPSANLEFGWRMILFVCYHGKSPWNYTSWELLLYCTFPQKNPLTQTLQINESKPANLLFFDLFLKLLQPLHQWARYCKWIDSLAYIPCYKLRLSSVYLGKTHLIYRLVTRDGFPPQSRRSTLAVFSTELQPPPSGKDLLPQLGDRKIRVVHGNTLTAAAVWQAVPTQMTRVPTKRWIFLEVIAPLNGLIIG